MEYTSLPGDSRSVGIYLDEKAQSPPQIDIPDIEGLSSIDRSSHRKSNMGICQAFQCLIQYNYCDIDHRPALPKLSYKGARESTPISTPNLAIGSQIIINFTSRTYRSGSPYVKISDPVSILCTSGRQEGLWAFMGSQGFVGIRLNRMTKITGFTIEHIPSKMFAAPRQMEVWGLLEGQWRERIQQLPMYISSPTGFPASVVFQPSIRLANFTYDIYDNLVQSYRIDTRFVDSDVKFSKLLLVVNNNWGETDFTCIYRLRIH
ncbi:hypothetical protein M422DRAFT_257402 [Sphaerobolus stellatus SS14]|uniref:SUN domain-containing protein n=1 Tax=Sphaerobolus stellatus (strain SS14) TaxID=990650 RepID=A0A0C9VNY6_SPHS4|nr:hypothetical protein M422DRAFT_257402 [Sphaerobolus stellatus SS14]